ncbi:viral RNA helicase/ superfamily I [Synechococcus sp. Minos11]|nr:viral RNA helicase/ superfamily I [Synechococcus sp. Minos11]
MMVDRFFDGGLEERLEGWIDRGREFVDGVAANAAASNRPRPSFSGTSSNSRRRPLDAISRRGQRPAPTEPVPGWNDADSEWPDDDVFSLPRWQRPEPARQPAPDPLNSAPPRRQPSNQRPLPRSSRRRSQG